MATPSAMLPGGQGGHPTVRHTPPGGGVPARPGLNQAQREAARYATRRDPAAGRAAWRAHLADAVKLLGRRDPGAAYAVVMAGHQAEASSNGFGPLRTRSAS